MNPPAVHLLLFSDAVIFSIMLSNGMFVDLPDVKQNLLSYKMLFFFILLLFFTSNNSSSVFENWGNKEIVL